MKSSLLLTAAVALAAGFGGSLLSRYVAPPAAHAQNPAQPSPPSQSPTDLRAQSFTLLDSSGQAVATFTAARGPWGPGVVLRDLKGHVLWSAGGSATGGPDLIRPLSQTVR